MRAHGIMFHHFCDDAKHPAGQGAMTGDNLLKLIAHVGRHNILPAQEWYWRATTHMLRPHQICLTFDDALRCQYDVALPILRANGLTAFWFVYTSVVEGNVEPLEIYRHFRTTKFASVDAFYEAFFASVTASDTSATDVRRALATFDPAPYLREFPFYTDNDRQFRFVRDEVLGPGRYHAAMERMMRDAKYNVRQAARDLWMSTGMLRELHAEGHVVGLHSHTHPTRLDRLSPAEQWQEYKTNHESLTRILGAQPRTMSHPCNAYTPETLDVLRRLDVRLGFRANTAQDTTSELEFPREDHANLMAEMRQLELAEVA